MPNIEDFSTLGTEDLIQALSISLYEPPLNRLHETLSSQPEVVRVLTLVLDFDTEVSMNGILGFLENSTGQWLGETIEAFDLIEANGTASVLRRIYEAMNRHGITSSALRAEVNTATPYTVMSFSELHGAKSEDISREVTQIARELYVGNPAASEDPWSLLCEYVTLRRQYLLDALRVT